jgi:hypothetical protein
MELAGFRDRDLVGVTSLAAGADQIFAFSVLACGGNLEVVVPANRYRSTLEQADLKYYDQLLLMASSTKRLPYFEPSEEAYYAAGMYVIDRCDILFAVWDGKPAGGLGGTADVVTEARRREVLVKVIWPGGSKRE